MSSPGDRRTGASHQERSPEGFEQRIGGFVALPALLRHLDADPEPTLAAAGLDLDAFSQPENRISYAAWGRTFARCAEATRHAQFGLVAGRMWHLADLGPIVGDVARHSATVGEAIETLTVYQHLNSGGGLAFVLKRAAIVDFGYAIIQPGIEGADQIYDAVLAAGYNYMRELAGTAWLPTEVFLPHSKPRDALLYRNYFKVMPHFDSEFCALRFPAYWLDRAVPNADSARRRAALVRAHAADKPDLQSQVRRALRRLLLAGKSSGDDLAQMLSMHRRTLNRRLRDQGTTFQQVLDEVRFEVARQLLSYSRVALDDIAASLGFAGVSPFMRTFRRWTGMTPGRWRREAVLRRPDFEGPPRDPFGPALPQRLPLVAPQGPWRAEPDRHELLERAPSPVAADLPPSPPLPRPRDESTAGGTHCSTEPRG